MRSILGVNFFSTKSLLKELSLFWVAGFLWEANWIIKYLCLCLCLGLCWIWMSNDLEYPEQTNRCIRETWNESCYTVKAQLYSFSRTWCRIKKTKLWKSHSPNWCNKKSCKFFFIVQLRWYFIFFYPFEALLFCNVMFILMFFNSIKNVL